MFLAAGHSIITVKIHSNVGEQYCTNRLNTAISIYLVDLISTKLQKTYVNYSLKQNTSHGKLLIFTESRLNPNDYVTHEFGRAGILTQQRGCILKTSWAVMDQWG